MQDSKRIAALVGPVLIALILTENPYVNPGLYDAQTPPVVYLNGTLLFVAGLALIRAHNRWALGWPIVLTILGWLAAAMGLARMTFPQAQIDAYNEGVATRGGAVVAGELVLLAIGIFLTVQGYRREK